MKKVELVKQIFEMKHQESYERISGKDLEYKNQLKQYLNLDESKVIDPNSDLKYWLEDMNNQKSKVIDIDLEKRLLDKIKIEDNNSVKKERKNRRIVVLGDISNQIDSKKVEYKMSCDNELQDILKQKTVLKDMNLENYFFNDDNGKSKRKRSEQKDLNIEHYFIDDNKESLLPDEIKDGKNKRKRSNSVSKIIDSFKDTFGKKSGKYYFDDFESEQPAKSKQRSRSRSIERLIKTCNKVRNIFTTNSSDKLDDEPKEKSKSRKRSRSLDKLWRTCGKVCNAFTSNTSDMSKDEPMESLPTNNSNSIQRTITVYYKGKKIPKESQFSGLKL